MVAQLARAQALVLRRGGAGLQRLGLLDQRADHERLPAGAQLLADAFVGPRALALAGAQVRLHRPAARGQLAQDRDVEVGEAAEPQRPGDGRGGHVQDVGGEALGRLGVQRGALAHAEPLLLVHHGHRQAVEGHGLLDQRVRSHHQRQLAAGQPSHDVARPASSR